MPGISSSAALGGRSCGIGRRLLNGQRDRAAVSSPTVLTLSIVQATSWSELVRTVESSLMVAVLIRPCLLFYSAVETDAPSGGRFGVKSFCRLLTRVVLR
jgi:hypothetical protein